MLLSIASLVFVIFSLFYKERQSYGMITPMCVCVDVRSSMILETFIFNTICTKWWNDMKLGTNIKRLEATPPLQFLIF
jgi:uncharacterized membrane-anchored protein